MAKNRFYLKMRKLTWKDVGHYCLVKWNCSPKRKDSQGIITFVSIGYTTGKCERVHVLVKTNDPEEPIGHYEFDDVSVIIKVFKKKAL